MVTFGEQLELALQMGERDGQQSRCKSPEATVGSWAQGAARKLPVGRGWVEERREERIGRKTWRGGERDGGQIIQHLADREEDSGFCSEKKGNQRLLGREVPWSLTAPQIPLPRAWSLLAAEPESGAQSGNHYEATARSRRSVIGAWARH